MYINNNTVYNVEGLNKQYNPTKYNIEWDIVSSDEQDFLYSRVAHEHAIFKRHAMNVLKIVGPFVAYACYMQFPDFQEQSLFTRIPFAFLVGYGGGVCVGEILCTVYKHLNLAIGQFISNNYDAYGHSDFLSENKPYLGEPLRRCHFAIYCFIFILIAKDMIGR